METLYYVSLVGLAINYSSNQILYLCRIGMGTVPEMGMIMDIGYKNFIKTRVQVWEDILYKIIKL